MPLPSRAHIKAPPAGYSFHDLAEGIGRGHKTMQMAPKAARIPNAERVLRPNELELEVLERYFNKGYLLDSKGDRLKPRVIPESLNPGAAKKAMDKGHLPDEGKIVFENSRGVYEPGESIGFHARDPSDFVGNPMLEAMYRNQKSGFFGGKPSPYSLTTTGMPAGLGKSAYAMMYDALRAGKHLNSIDVLTSANQLRRPGNVMSSGLAHGDYEHLPLFQGDSDINPFYSTLSGQRGDWEEKALKSLLGPGNRYDTATALGTRDTLRYSPEAQTGLLALREAQLARSHGIVGVYEDSIFDHANPMDLDALKRYAEAARQGGAQPGNYYGSSRAFGPGLLGRAGSTEAFISGMERGIDPEEVARKLLELPGASDAIKGRYRKGGLVAALES
jgi:hypothetical protein